MKKLKENQNWLVPLVGAIAFFCMLFGALYAELGKPPAPPTPLGWSTIFTFVVLCWWFYLMGYYVGKYLNKE